MSYKDKNLLIDNSGKPIPQIWDERVGDFVPATNENNVQIVNFHDGTSSASEGVALNVGGFKTLTIEIYGSSTSRTIEFKATSVTGNKHALSGVNLSDWTMESSTTGTNEIWQFDVTGLEQVTIEVTAISGGDVTVKGKAVV